MSKFIETGAMALGGLSLFGVCFLAFALMAGVPAHEVAVIGKLFPAPPEEESDPAPSSIFQEEPSPATDREAIRSNVAILETWSLPSPFTSDELQGIAEELKATREILRSRSLEQDQRESELDDREERIDERLLALASLQQQLELQEAELDLRAQEVRRDEKAEDEFRQKQLRAVAKIIQTKKDDPAKAVPYLTPYPPEEVAIILASLDAKQASALLDELQKKSVIKDFKPYLDAYAKAAAATD